MKYLSDGNGGKKAIICDDCEKRVYRYDPVYRYGHKILCENCLKERTELHWWDMGDDDDYCR